MHNVFFVCFFLNRFSANFGLFQITTPYYDTLFSLGKKDGAIQAFHDGLRSFELELKNRGGVYFGGSVVVFSSPEPKAHICYR